MTILLTPEEYKKLVESEKELEKEADKIATLVKSIMDSDADFFNSTRYESLRRKLHIDIPRERERLRNKIASAKIIDKTEIEFDGLTVSIGTVVTLDYDGDIAKFTIMPICENEINEEVISCNTPIAQVILGKKKGDIVTFRDCAVKIIDVVKAWIKNMHLIS